MRVIQDTFRKNGFDYFLDDRIKNVAIYKQMKGGVLYGWEVHKIRIAKPSTLKIGKKVREFPLREILASNEDVGKYGWSYQSKDNAIKKFKELTQT